jgi:nitrile hydratase beta subunit
MNGIHDMGGMQDMGPIVYEKDEPVFHAPWEGRVYAMMSVVGRTGKFRLGLRPPMENIPALQYLQMSYYERWLTSLIERLIASDLVTRAEIESGRPSKEITIAATNSAAAPTDRETPAAPRFQTGERVRARNINLVTHTRLPRYARGKVGTIERDNGISSLEDSSAYSLGDKPQHVYSVRFSAYELWGDRAAPQDAVYIDMWDDYLEPA